MQESADWLFREREIDLLIQEPIDTKWKLRRMAVLETTDCRNLGKEISAVAFKYAVIVAPPPRSFFRPNNRTLLVDA